MSKTRTPLHRLPPARSVSALLFGALLLGACAAGVPARDEAVIDMSWGNEPEPPVATGGQPPRAITIRWEAASRFDADSIAEAQCEGWNVPARRVSETAEGSVRIARYVCEAPPDETSRQR